VTFSSDLVFDGQRRMPYVESDAPAPVNVYGLSKVEAESAVRQIDASALIVRTSAFFGRWDEYNFVTRLLRDLAERRLCHAPDDQIVSPTYVPGLAHATLDLLVDGETGVWHLANRGALTWAAFGALVAEQAGYDPQRVVGAPGATLGWNAARPAYSALGIERGWLLPSLPDAGGRYLKEREGAVWPVEDRADRRQA